MPLRKILGILFVMTAAAGILISLIGLVEIWRCRPAVTKTVMDDLALVDQALNSTREALSIIDKEVQAPSLDVASMQATIQALDQVIQDVDPALDQALQRWRHAYLLGYDRCPLYKEDIVL